MGRVSLLSAPYVLGVTPITQGEYESVMGENPSFYRGPGKERHPVEQVCWFDAIEFCNRLSESERLLPYYNYEPERRRVTILGGNGYRLPREYEWEQACQCGRDTAFCFGDRDKDLADYAWYRNNSEGTTHPVATKKPNDWGFYDMHGNVWEWMEDSWGYDRVVRGGSFENASRGCRTHHRYASETTHICAALGFRIARTPNAEPRE